MIPGLRKIVRLLGIRCVDRCLPFDSLGHCAFRARQVEIILNEFFRESQFNYFGIIESHDRAPFVIVRGSDLRSKPLGFRDYSISAT